MKSIIYIVVFSLAPYLLVGQCFQDRHSTNIHESWLSCTASPNPNPAHGTSHWIMYDLGQLTSLHQSTLWNMNHPDFLESGIKDIIVEYSVNGSSWTSKGTYSILQAGASGFYEGVPGPNFDGVFARYVLITAIDNYGGGCYGFSEFRIFTEDYDQNVSLNLNIETCINEGVLTNIDGGLGFGGNYFGPGVTNNFDETFDFDPDVAGVGTHTLSYGYLGVDGPTTITENMIVIDCVDEKCPPCVSCDDDPQSTFDDIPIPNGIYHKQVISSEGHVQNNYNVDFRGEESVTLEPSFEVSAGGYFVAQIRECDVVLGANGGYEQGMTNWTHEQHDGAVASRTIDTNDPYADSQSARVAIDNESNGLGWWHVQFKQTGASLVQGQEYKVTFAAKADQNREVHFFVGRDNSPYNTYESWDIVLEPYWKLYQFTFTPDEDNNGFVRLAAGLGENPTGSVFWFDNFELRQ